MPGIRALSFAVATAIHLAMIGGVAPSWAQAPQQVAVLEGDAPGEYRALGVVSVEVHQKSIFTKTPAKEQLDQALRAEAAKLGADAVIQVKYDLSNPMMSKEGHHATGVAVKFSLGRTQMAAAPVPTPPAVMPPAVAPPVIAPAAVTPAPAAAPATIAPSQPSLPPSTVVVAGAANGATAAAPPAPRPAPVIAPSMAAPVAAAAPPQPAAPRRATPAASILVSDQTVLGRAYEQLGEVSAVTHQKSIFTKTPPLETLKSALQVEAAKLGADAIVGFSYKMSNAMTSNKGNQAKGIAVRFTDAAAAPVAAAPAPVAAAPAPIAPPVVAPTAPVQPAAAPPVQVAAAPAVRHANMPAAIFLTEQDLAGQRYVRLGPVEAVTHQKSIFTKTPPLETLKSALQAEAAKLGADAVIQVKYDLSNPMMSNKGHKATGVAVRFE